jgi:hypothetical protein
MSTYLENLKRQKQLISDLGSSSGSKLLRDNGLNVDAIARNLAALDQNLKKTEEYYKSLAESEILNEEQAQANAGITETEEQKEERRSRKTQEVLKKGEESVNNFIESQRDFIQEQISIIEVNYAIIEQETKGLPKTISLAITTALQPAAVGAAVPNFLYNLGILFQNLQSIRRSLGNIKSSFLNILIAADKIKFALPGPVIDILERIVNIEDLLKKDSPSEESIDQPPPPAPVGSRITLLIGEFAISEFNIEYATVTAESKFGINVGQVGKIVNVTGDSEETITSIEIEVVNAIPPPPPPPKPEPEPEKGGKDWNELTTGGKIFRALTFPVNLAFRKRN